MKIQFLGATESVGGSEILLKTESGLNILVDCGFVQHGNPEEMFRLNSQPLEYNVEDIDIILVTHFHFDHVAKIGLLVNQGFRGKIMCTKATADFMELNLRDSAKIMKSDAFRIKTSKPSSNIYPLYDDKDVDMVMDLTRGYGFDTEIILSDTEKVVFKRAGHVLGASIIHLTYTESNKEKIIAFSGDTSCMRSKPYLPIADDLGNIGGLVIEATYGNKIHERDQVEEVLAKAIQETCVDNKKVILIPSFALQRSSELLWILREIYIKNEHFYKIPIYLDSPMSVRSQELMDSNREFWGKKWLDRDEELGNIFKWEVINYISDHKESENLNKKDPMIIISSSGMLNNGRVLMHLEDVLRNRGNQIILSGYQAQGTLGRRLLDTECKSISVNKRPIPIRAKIQQINLSSHGDKNQIVEYIKSSRRGILKTIYINHGEKEACEELKRELDLHFKDIEVIIAKQDVIYK